MPKTTIREIRTFPATEALRWQALAWANQFSPVHFFNNNHLDYPFGAFANRLAVGCAAEVPLIEGDTFGSLRRFHRQHRDWLVGGLSYDLKNELEALTSQHPNRLGFPPAYFYQPQHLLDFGTATVTIRSLGDARAAWEEIRTFVPPPAAPLVPIVAQCRVSPGEYARRVARIRRHIRAGDVYELNYCVEFFAENAHLDPLATYQRLNALSPMPFSVYHKIGEQYLLGASPERFLRKTGRALLSQPIKGTVRRGQDAAEDERLRHQLRHDEKEMAENMMIVDLVRNDLARSAAVGSVAVEEMFGIYTFRQVHQMISSVSARLRPAATFADALRHAFPMGSMTGAPKIRAMQLIDELEVTRRGWYAGAVGYVAPNGDFDFNVVIRSILHNAATGYLSFQVGSAITYDAVASREYAECLLKARAMQAALAGN